MKGFSASEVATAIEANISAQIPLMYAHMPGVEVCDESDLLGMMSKLPDPLLNSVYWAAFPHKPEQAGARIDATLDCYGERGRLPLTWVVSPSTQPRDLGRYLEARGFTCFSRGTPGMAVDLRTAAAPRPAPAGLTIERVGDAEQLGQWLRPVRVSFELQETTAAAFFDLFAGRGFGPEVPWQLFVGLVDGQPVAASRLFCAAGVAGIFHVATLPQARGRGFGTALTLAAMRAGREQGYRAGVLAASGEGYSLYRRLGFQKLVQVDIYLGPS